MKILITGANSYIGVNIADTIRSMENKSVVDTLDIHGKAWESTDFSAYEVIINVAAIVHRPDAPADLYYTVNRDLVIAVAKKAKAAGVSQFIQLSTMSVFGIDIGPVDENCKLCPYNDYGKSKAEADVALAGLSDEYFKVCIIRPPMIYGSGCKGNYVRMEKFALSFPVFPSLKNKKDLIYIENIIDFILYAIKQGLGGVFYPKDPQLDCTSEMIQKIAQYNGRRVRLWSVFNPFVKFLIGRSRIFTSVFSDNYCLIEDGSGWVAPIDLDEAMKRMYQHNE